MDHEKKRAIAEEIQTSTGLSRLWDLIKDQWFLIVLVALVIFSFQVQVPEDQQGLKTRIVQNLTIAAMFFINGLAIPTQDLVANLRHWRCHVFIQLMGFFFTSLTTLGIVLAIASNRALLDPLLLNGLVVLGCLPTALSVNTLMTRKAEGNATLTLTESVVGNAIGPFLSSLLVIGYTSIGVWYTETMPKAVGGLGVLLQRAFGQLIQSYFPELVRMLLQDYHILGLGSLSLLVLIWSGYDSAFASHALADVEKAQIIGVIGICLAVFLLWMSVAMATSVVFLGREDAVAAAFCIPTKSPALGIPLVTVLFAGMSAEDTAKVYIPLIVFQFMQTCLSNLATLPLRHWRTEARYQSDSKSMSDSESLA